MVKTEPFPLLFSPFPDNLSFIKILNSIYQRHFQPGSLILFLIGTGIEITLERTFNRFLTKLAENRSSNAVWDPKMEFPVKSVGRERGFMNIKSKATLILASIFLLFPVCMAQAQEKAAKISNADTTWLLIFGQDRIPVDCPP